MTIKFAKILRFFSADEVCNFLCTFIEVQQWDNIHDNIFRNTQEQSLVYRDTMDFCFATN